jgi:hypothetical protein
VNNNEAHGNIRSNIKPSGFLPIIKLSDATNCVQLESICDIRIDFTGILEVIVSLGYDKEDFYFHFSPFRPFCYCHDWIYIDFHSFDKSDILDLKKHYEHHNNLIDKYLLEKNFNSLFFLIHKIIRIEVLMEIFDIIPDEEKLEIFKFVYSSMDYGFNKINKDFLEKLIKYRHPIGDVLTDNKGYVTVYRGHGSKSTPYLKAFSWTADLNTAKFFVNRWGTPGKIYRGKVHTDNIITYIDEREEKEVIVMPGSVKNVRKVEIPDA